MVEPLLLLLVLYPRGRAGGDALHAHFDIASSIRLKPFADLPAPCPLTPEQAQHLADADGDATWRHAVLDALTAELGTATPSPCWPRAVWSA